MVTDDSDVCKKYLITGGDGFIGVNLSKFLISRGDYVHIIDNVKTLYSKNSYFITLKNSIGVSFLYLTYSSSCPHFLSLIVSNILTPLT